MFCMECGAQIAGAAKFCAKCGAAVVSVEQVNVAPQATTAIEPRNVSKIVKYGGGFIVGIVVLIVVGLLMAPPHKNEHPQTPSQTPSSSPTSQVAANSKSNAPSAVPRTAPSAEKEIVEIDGMKVFLGEVTPTELSIKLRNKRARFMGVATGKADYGTRTEITFENGMLTCEFTSDETRLFAGKMGRTGYEVVGDYVGVSGRTIQLTNCVGKHL